MRIRVLEGSLVAALVCMLVAGSALAQDKGVAQGAAKKAPPAAANAEVKFGFSPQDRATIAAYYPPRPPGKRDEALPIGIEKQWQRNEKLPPVLQNRIQKLPAELEGRLGSLPLAYRRGILDGHLLVYMPSSHVIVDVILNSVR